jgi:glycolate oxidase iron-sulfur subunit
MSTAASLPHVAQQRAISMQTSFTSEQLKDPAVAESERILRACVHCGFCTATCPTYVLLGDELDSPRGRIYLIKEMLEHDRPATADVVKHIDRCLSCLACMTTCPSGVNYMHLVDHARVHIERTYRRPFGERLLRGLIARILPNPRLFRVLVHFARLAKPLGPVLRLVGARRLGAMLRLIPRRIPRRPARAARTAPAAGARKARVALLDTCVDQVLAPEINAAAVRVLTRHGVEVVRPPAAGCCGALVHHLGRERESLRAARRNVDAWTREVEGDGLDAILVTASGCGTTVKDYGFMLRDDPAYATKAQRIAGLAKDISEYLVTLMLEQPVRDSGLVVAYHAACSLQHGQKVVRAPKALLTRTGFTIRDVPEGHICCGSAGTYNMLQPRIARRLATRKAANIARVSPDIIATGNIGCMTQIATATAIPVVHTVQLVDWATGGPLPERLRIAGIGEKPERRHEAVA